jgi:hypothetical protein
MPILAIILATFLLMGSHSVAQENDSPYVNICGEGLQIEFEDWRQWLSVTPEPVRSKGHSNNWVGIFVDKLAEDTYLSASSPYLPCARIVKPIYTDESGSKVRKLTVMMKMAPGFDPENADWWYGIYDASGTEVWDEGKLPDCIICHQQAADTDYLFSNEVMHTNKE